MNVAEMAEHAAERLGERLVLDFEGQQFTNFQILDWGRRLQRGFFEIGIRPSDTIILCMMNHPLVYPTFQGIFRSQAIALPVMFTLTENEIRYVVSDSKATGVVTDAANLEKVRGAVKEMEHVRWIVVLGKQDDFSNPIPEYGLENLCKNDPMTELPDIKEEDMAMMLYTAGTTGKPKGVMITHKNLYAQAEASFDASELATRTVPRVAVSAMPMAHVYGVAVMMGGYVTPKHLVNGYSVQLAWFEPEKFMQRIVQHQCNMMAVVPTMLVYLLNHPRLDDYDLSCVTEVVSSAAPLPYEVAKAFIERFDCRICEAYGQTESTGMITANRLSRPYKPGSCGQAYCNVEIRIVDENDQPLSTGETGEITARGPTVMKGYFNRPEETAEVIRNGWLHTGDMGYLDEDGYLFIVDRKKDLIIKGGENIFPAELEEHLYTISGVAEAAVVGISDPVFGENVAAYVVLKPGVTLSSQDIISQMKTKISSFKLPQKINFIDELPKSPVGKILRRVLRDRARTSQGVQTA